MNPKVPFFMHDLGEAELKSVADVLSGPILTTGAVVHEFENRFSEYLGVKHTLGVTSCTGALHLSLMALGIGAGDEVITTPLTFAATALATLELDPEKLLPEADKAMENVLRERYLPPSGAPVSSR